VELTQSTGVVVDDDLCELSSSSRIGSVIRTQFVVVSTIFSCFGELSSAGRPWYRDSSRLVAFG
jgi:hypothetical protein